MSAKKVLIIIADTNEECEIVIPADCLRVCGINVTIAGLKGCQPVTCARGILLTPDCDFNSIPDEEMVGYDGILLPGGRDVDSIYRGNPKLGRALKKFDESGKIVATICAAGIVLKENGVAIGRRVTTHPSRLADFSSSQYQVVDQAVVRDGHVITSQAPGTAFAFSLAIIEGLYSSNPDEGQQLVDYVKKRFVI